MNLDTFFPSCENVSGPIMSFTPHLREKFMNEFHTTLDQNIREKFMNTFITTASYIQH